MQFKLKCIVVLRNHFGMAYKLYNDMLTIEAIGLHFSEGHEGWADMLSFLFVCVYHVFVFLDVQILCVLYIYSNRTG